VGRFLSLLALAVVACVLLGRALSPAPVASSAPAARLAMAPAVAPTSTPGSTRVVPRGPRPVTEEVSAASGSATEPDLSSAPTAAAAHLDPRSGRLPTAGVTGVDALGRREVRYDNGVTASSRVDPLGGVSTRYSNGVTAESRTDPLGSTTTRFSNGVTAISRVDALGHVETRFSDGTSATTRVDALGNRVTTYSDGRTETLRPDPSSPPPTAAEARRPGRR
jgi:hypothetical protein